MQLLLKHKVDVNAKAVDRLTALQLAAEKGHEAVVQLLLEHKANVNAKTEDRRTALLLAAKNGHKAVA